MFIGHFGLGLAAKRAAPGLSLAVLFAAAQFADMLWPLLVLAGLEEVRILPGITRFTPLEFVSYPYSHSLVLLVLWGVGFGWLARRRDPNAFVVVSALVVSHWVLDVITHRPDLPLYPGSAKFGLGLWNSIVGTVAAELPIFLVGVWVYFRTTRPRDRAGIAGIAILLALLLAIYAANVVSQTPPPSETAIAIVGVIGACLFTAWAGYADRHREVPS
jgi:membrane-bound metal-dependent hydrolase YbcI (DUF457 family)